MLSLKHMACVAIGLFAMLTGLARADDTKVLSWEDLLPEGETQQIPAPSHGPGGDLPGSGAWGNEMSDSPIPMQSMLGGIVEEYNGKQVKLPGFVVPLEYSDKGRVKEFLLVPYFGACIHYPPPPPNQISLETSMRVIICTEGTRGLCMWAISEIPEAQNFPSDPSAPGICARKASEKDP